MYYDEKRGRYVIEGEEESDDDEPPPPPPAAKKEQPVDKKEPDQSGLNSLTTPGFSGALAGKGRAKGRMNTA